MFRLICISILSEMLLRMQTSLWVFLFIALAALLLAGPLWELPGLPGGDADSLVHIHRSGAVYRSFDEGVFWPRWFADVYRGLGSPAFHHYSPGLYWLVAAVHWTGLGLAQALKLVLTAGFILAGLGAFAWLRHVFSTEASLVGAALYLFFPFAWAREFFSPDPFGGAYPKLLALLLLPVCLWAFTSLHRQGLLRNWLAACVSLTALVYIHNLTAMMGASILFLFWLLLAIGYRRPEGVLRCAVAALVAALMSAAFWLPSIADLPFVQSENVRTGYFEFDRHFLDFRQLYSFQSPVLDSRNGNPLSPILTFGAASWLALVAGMAGLFFTGRRETRVWGMAGIIFILAMLALTQKQTEPLWENVSALSFFQFPNRFLAVAPLGALPAAALAIEAWPVRMRWLPCAIFVMALSLTLFPYLFPSHTMTVHLPNLVGSLTAEDTRSLEQAQELWGMTTSNEFLVRDADLSVATGQAPEPNATQPTWSTPHGFVVELSDHTEPMLLRTHFHPGWSAGDRATLSQGPAGWMQVSSLSNPGLPLEIRWEGTAAQRWGERLSLAGLIALVAGLAYLAIRNRSKGRSRRPDNSELSSEERNFTSQTSALAVGAMAGCLFAFIVARIALDRSDRGPFLLNSPPGQLAFPIEGDPSEIGDASSSQLTLLGWEQLGSDTPRAGGRVRVRLFWQPHGPIKEELLSFLQLYVPAMQRSWAVENRGVARPDSQWWDPTKYYVDDLLLHLPEDLPPANYSLVAGMVSSSGERLTVPGTEDNLLHLRTLDVAPIRPGFMQRTRPAVEATAATDDGLQLQGYDLLPAADSPTLRLFWETGEGIVNDWITYVHMHDGGGERVAQFDGPAIAGLQTTSQWHSNALYVDRRRLILPEAIEPGEYLLRIGLYDRVSGVRLPFLPSDNSQGNFENGQLLVPLSIELSGQGSK